MPNTGKKLVYSRKKREGEFKGKTLNPHFLDIIATRCTKDIEEAKRRVTVTKDGKYKYEPSKEYIRHYAKSCSNK